MIKDIDNLNTYPKAYELAIDMDVDDVVRLIHEIVRLRAELRAYADDDYTAEAGYDSGCYGKGAPELIERVLSNRGSLIENNDPA